MSIRGKFHEYMREEAERQQSGGFFFRQTGLKKKQGSGGENQCAGEKAVEQSSCGCEGVGALVLMRMGGAREGEGGTRSSLFPLPHYSALLSL